ncbi:putative E3 ubiquitin-protein ligase herc1 [Bulinus truncatus]|nr:putative E3 ubiquitin-protein ligase herc1 [Bulinus truncatus]
MALQKFKFKWIEHFNSIWVEEDCEGLTLKDDLESLYQRLVANKEIVCIPPQAIFLKGPTLPDFNPSLETYNIEEQEHLLDSLLSNQLFLAEVVSSNTPFAQVLMKRVLVLQRMYYALSQKYHAIIESSSAPVVVSLDTKKIQSQEHTEPLSPIGSDALIKIGSESLSSVTNFLRLAATPQSGADLQGQQLASQLMLTIAMQRGLLHHLLDWVDLALRVSATAQSEAKKGIENKYGLINGTFFKAVLAQMIDKTTNINHTKITRTPLTVNQEGMLPMFEAAMFLLEELHCAADEYTNTGAGPIDYNPSSSVAPGNKASQSVPASVYVWGSNSSHQLAEGSQEKILTPKLTTIFADCQQVEAGQFCSFLLHPDGSVSACGKGSYGRLGLGDSNNQTMPRKLTFDSPVVIKKISSSKGSDGHTLALNTEGELYSWGDGDYGKLGLGGNHTQKSPKLIQGPLAQKVVKTMSAGYRHSAAVTFDGQLYTWGEGDYGRLGHGDKTSRNLPKQVKDIGLVGQVACGSSHTLAVSQDGKTVWSFGGGDNGKLGHGDMNRQTKPAVIEAFSGMYIRKVACSSQASLALTSTGQVYAWGTGSCLGFGLADFTAMTPKLIEDLQGTKIMDITCGDSHCLALSHDNEVFAWGNNAMGQCGQGHAQSPVTRPRKVIGLEGAHIQQISAGTSHSVATTALPYDRQVIAWHRPFCVDLQEATFTVLSSFLEHYCDGFDNPEPPSPFANKQQHQQFVLLCLKLLSSHLSLALTCGLGSEVLGNQTKPLRILLFRLVDTNTPDEIQKTVIDTLSIGASLLLPPLRERMELLHSLLPHGPDSWESLTKGQRMQLSIILTSLQDNQHIAALLSLSHQKLDCVSPTTDSTGTELHLAELLMKTILRNLAAHAERSLNELSNHNTHFSEMCLESSPPANLHYLLSSLQKHLLAYCYNKSMTDSKLPVVVKHLHQHLMLLLPVCGDIITHTTNVISRTKSDYWNVVFLKSTDVVLQSPAGKMLTHVLNAVLVLPLPLVMPVLHHILTLLPQLDKLCKLLPSTSYLEESELEFKQDEADVPAHQKPWSWLIDLERTCGLVVGSCIGGMLHGPPLAQCEVDCEQWLNSLLFSNGLQSATQLKKISSLISEMTLESPESLSSLCKSSSMDGETAALLDLALGVPNDTNNVLLTMMIEFAVQQDLNTCELKEERWLELVTRFFLAAMLRHCNLWKHIQEHDWPLKQLEAIFLMVYKIRFVLVSFRCRNPEEDSDKTLIGQRCTETKLDVPHNDTREEELISESPEHSRVENLEENIDADSDHEHHETDVDEEQQLASRVTPQEKKNEFSYEEMCYKYLEKCIFLLLCVRPPLSGDSSEFLQNTVKKAQQNEGSLEMSDLSEMSPRRTITRQGSLPDISSDMQDDQVAGFRDGMGTPTLNSLNPRHQLAPNLNSLQKVKEMLRRLRWRQERINAIGSGQGWNKKEPCNFPENRIVTDMMQFVCGEQKNGYIDNLDVEQLVKAMELQQERAESRLYALNQIIELLTTGKEKDDEPKNNSSPNTTLLNSVHLQLLAGCFGLLVLRSEYTSVSNQLYHYQDGIRAASAQTQQEIQLVVHQIYEVLVMSLIDLIKMDNIGQYTKKHLMLSSILALSVKYKPVDVSLTVSCGLPPVLLELCGSNTIYNSHTLPPVTSLLEPSHLCTILSVSSLRLLQIIAVTVGTFADRLSGGVVQSVIELLWKQLDELLEHKSIPSTEIQSMSEVKQVNLSSVADLLVFLRHVMVTKGAQRRLTEWRWVKCLIHLACGQDGEGHFCFDSLRVRILALQLLGTVLPALDAQQETEYKTKVVDLLFSSLATIMWSIPVTKAISGADKKRILLASQLEGAKAKQQAGTRPESGFPITSHGAPVPYVSALPGTSTTSSSSQDSVLIQSAAFDPDRCVACTVEVGHTLVHGSGGRGYGLGSTVMTSGCYQWKFLIVRENRGNEGTCVGVSKWPVRDCGHRTTGDMWLYRAYSGNLYHNGETSSQLSSFTQGDYITVILDMDARTLAFAKNAEDPKLAFEDVDATELYPCVTFYSSSPGEKVKITDMHLRESPRELLAGSPLCAPTAAVMSEAMISLILSLHVVPVWSTAINDHMCNQLQTLHTWLEEMQLQRTQQQQISHDGSTEEKKDTKMKSMDSAEEKEKMSHSKESPLSDEEKTKKNEGDKTKEQINKLKHEKKVMRDGQLTCPVDDIKLEHACNTIWPCLAVIAGVDHGLRIGGRCIHKTTGKKGIVLGLPREAAITAKVQWDEGDSTISDTVLSNLEPLEGSGFDMSSLTGFQSHHLDALVKLAFMRDSRSRADSTGSFRSSALEKFKERIESESHAVVARQRTKERCELLMRELDRDISAMLEEDLNTVDHNADKKTAAEEVSRQGSKIPASTPGEIHNIPEQPRMGLRREMRAVSVDSADTAADTFSLIKHRNPISASEMNLNSDLDRLSQLGSQTISAQPKIEVLHSEQVSTEQDSPAFSGDFTVTDFPLIGAAESPGFSKPSEDRYPINSNQKVHHLQSTELPATTIATPEKINREGEMHILKFAALQLSAVKSLSALSSCEKFLELLLVPRNTSKDGASEKHFLDSVGGNKDESMRSSLRQMMKLFVSRSTYPSPFKRAVPLAEIERAFNVIHNSIIQHIAEDRFGVTSLEDNIAKLTANSKKGLDLHLNEIPSSVPKKMQLSDTHMPGMASSADGTDGTSTFGSGHQTSILQYMRTSSSAEDMRGFTRRMFNALKPSGVPVICTSSTPTPARRPHPPNPIRSRSPSPPPPPIVTPLLEMGFGLQHIKQALAATGVTGREVSARSTNLLATWMLEHPMEAEPEDSDIQDAEAGIRDSMPPFTILPDDIGMAPLATEREMAIEALSERLDSLMLSEDSDEEAEEYDELPRPSLSRRPRRLTRGRHVDIRSFLSAAARDRRNNRPERRQEVGEARPMFDIYDDFELQDDFFSEDGLDFDDPLSLETARDAAKVMSVIRWRLEQNNIVKCEICSMEVTDFNHHMRTTHPGCGNSSRGFGYRSLGLYDGGWFDGACGTGNPFYLMCQTCRENSIQANQEQRSLRASGVSSERLPQQASGLAAPDFMGVSENKPEDEMPLVLEDPHTVSGIDHHKLLPRLGLTENKPLPDPVRFTELDPLGSCIIVTSPSENTPPPSNAITGATSSLGSRSNPDIACLPFMSGMYLMGVTSGAMPKNVKCEVKQKSLGEQAAHLNKMADKVVALKSCISASQTLVARAVSMKILSFLAQCSQACSLSGALEQIGLADIMQIVRLMSLCAAGKMELLNKASRNDESTKHLNHLTSAIGALIEDNPSALKQLIQLCTHELMMASMGMHAGNLEDHSAQRHLPSPCSGESTAFAVTQALVSLLAQKGWNYKLLQAQLSAEKESPSSELSKCSHLQMLNALSACVISARMSPQHRQWSAKQLVRALSAYGQQVTSGSDNQVDLGGDMPQCPIIKLEGHQNRLNGCWWNARKSYLASSGYDGTVRIWSLPNKTHQFLQQTCIFNRGQEANLEELDGNQINLVCWSSTGKLLAGCMENLVNIWMIGGGRGYLIEQSQWVTALTWPGSKGMFEGRVGLIGDSLLVGRHDGTVGLIDMIDSSTYISFELEHCKRRNGKY